MVKIGLRLFGLVALLAVSTATFAYEIWYQDNSFGKGGVLPGDFVHKFEHPESWEEARGKLDVYMFRANVFRFPDFSDEFISKHMVPQLRGAGVKYAIDTAAPLFSGCKDRSARFDFEFETMQRLRQHGIAVSYVSLQSILSKPDQASGVGACSMEDRIRGGVDYARQFVRHHPSAEVGIIDALPSHGKPYKEAYKLVRDTFRMEGVPLSYIHLDISADQVMRGDHGLSWKKVVEVERYVKKLGLKFGIYLNSRRAGQLSDEAFYKSSVEAMANYLAAGGDADHYVISSWFRHPLQSVRSHTVEGSQYPATDLILEFASRLEAPAQKDLKQRN